MKNLKLFERKYLKTSLIKFTSASLVGLMLTGFLGCSLKDNKEEETGAIISLETTFEIGKHIVAVDVNMGNFGKHQIPSPADGYEFLDADYVGDSNGYMTAFYVNSEQVIAEGIYNEDTGTYNFNEFGIVDPSYSNDFPWGDEEPNMDNQYKTLLYQKDI